MLWHFTQMKTVIITKKQWVLVPRVAWKACLERPCGKQRTDIVCNTSNHEVINAILPKSCIGIFNRCLVSFSILGGGTSILKKEEGCPRTHSFLLHRKEIISFQETQSMQ